MSINSMLTNFFDLTFFQSVIATTVGVILGIPAALFVNGLIEKSSERERKNKILQVIKKELLDNKLQIQRSRQSVEEFPLAELRFESWNAFSDGGELQWIKDPDLLGKLSETYANIRILANLYSTEMEVAHFGRRQERVIADFHLSDETDKLTHAVQLQKSRAYDNILETLETLESELTKLG
ncbi:MAG TPA: hypothetical protein VIN60_08470 [Anaerolineales bacterium]